jgi:hypothetical protein
MRVANAPLHPQIPGDRLTPGLRARLGSGLLRSPGALLRLRFLFAPSLGWLDCRLPPPKKRPLAPKVLGRG